MGKSHHHDPARAGYAAALAPSRQVTLKEQRNAYEDRVLLRLKELLPEGIGVTIVADRGFGDQKLFVTDLVVPEAALP